MFHSLAIIVPIINAQSFEYSLLWYNFQSHSFTLSIQTYSAVAAAPTPLRAFIFWRLGLDKHFEGIRKYGKMKWSANIIINYYYK